MDKAAILRKEGLEIIETFRFLDLLARFGESRLVGSVALDLVVKPDIDFHLFVGQKQVLEVAKSILEELIVDKRIAEIRISDYLGMDSLKLGIDRLPGRTRDWSVDIWITSNRNTLGFEELEKYKTLLGEEKRKTILKIKRHYFEKGLLRDGLSSWIYRAVFLENISTIEGFQEFLSGILGSEEENQSNSDREDRRM